MRQDRTSAQLEYEIGRCRSKRSLCDVGSGIGEGLLEPGGRGHESQLSRRNRHLGENTCGS